MWTLEFEEMVEEWERRELKLRPSSHLGISDLLTEVLHGRLAEAVAERLGLDARDVEVSSDGPEDVVRVDGVELARVEAYAEREEGGQVYFVWRPLGELISDACAQLERRPRKVVDVLLKKRAELEERLRRLDEAIRRLSQA